MNRRIGRKALAYASAARVRSAAVSRAFALAFALLAAPASAAETAQEQTRRVESALARLSQEQQSVYQQFQMAQELRRSELQIQPLQNFNVPATPPNYDDVKREQQARAQRMRDLQSEIDRLYARYREIEEQKRPLLETLSALAQQRPEEKPAPGDIPAVPAAPAPPPPPASTGPR